jgi:NAD(P)H-dependent flavin oxidoreductase YrpB (nitropropane dioxygenase family)
MIATRFTELVGCTVPIQQAGMGAAAPPELAAAVSEAGALGMLGTARPGLTPATLASLLDQLRTLTTKPFGVNFIVAPQLLKHLDLRCVEIAARAARVVEFFYGTPDHRLVDMAHEYGALVSWQIGSREEAEVAAKAGCDFVVAQGVEAGGHVRGMIGMMTLLDEVTRAVDMPVLAAGGIGVGQAVAAAIAAGAAGVRVGTRFLAATEASMHPEYVAALIAARAGDTTLTDLFARGWRNAPHRVLRSSIVAAEAFQGDVVGEWANVDGTLIPSRRFDTTMATSSTTGAISAMPLWAGESVGAVKHVQSAAEIVRELLEDCGR